MDDPRPQDPTTVRIHGRSVDIEAIQNAIRQRVAQRSGASLPAGAGELARAAEERLRPLTDWNLPRHVWDAMYPPLLRPWNLDEPYPIRSHRGGVAGHLLVVVKRVARAFLAILGRPLLTQQVEINRTLSLLTRTLADEVTRLQAHVIALEGRLARAGTHERERRGEVPPLVQFADDHEAGKPRV